MSVFHPSLALDWNSMPHLYIRKIIGKHILAGGGYSHTQDVPWGLHLFICVLKKKAHILSFHLEQELGIISFLLTFLLFSCLRDLNLQNKM